MAEQKWHIETRVGFSPLVKDQWGTHIATVYADRMAPLVAASPLLLEVAEAFVAEFGKVSPNGTGGLYGRVQKARAAIAAARWQA